MLLYQGRLKLVKLKNFLGCTGILRIVNLVTFQKQNYALHHDRTAGNIFPSFPIKNFSHFNEIFMH